MGEGRTDEPQANQRLTVAQAAEVLGITEGAVRSRIKRGTLPTTKEAGAVFVLLGGGTSTANQPPKTDVPSAQSELVEELRDRIRYLERQVEEANERDRESRRVMLALTSRIPELQAAPQEPSESPESPGPNETPPDTPAGPQTATERPETGGERRPWWRRMFRG